MTSLLQYKNPSYFDDIEFSATVEKLDIFDGILSEGEPDLSNVVNSVTVRYSASYSDGDNEYVAFSTFSPGLPYPATSDEFIDYSTLTEAQIISWLEQQPSDEAYKHSLALAIDEQVSARTELALPWASDSV